MRRVPASVTIPDGSSLMTRMSAKRSRSVLACAAGAAALVLAANPQPAAASSFAVTNAIHDQNDTQMCLGVTGGNMTNGTALILWRCDGTPNQQWTLPSPDFPQQMHNGANYNKCLGALNQGTADGTQLVIWDCNDHPDQLWQESQLGSGQLEIHNANTVREVLAIAGDSDAPGAPAILWHVIPTGDQVWSISSGGTVTVP